MGYIRGLLISNMGFFDFLLGKKNEFKITFRKDKELFIKDVVCGDVVKLWKPEDEMKTVSFYDKVIEERLGYKNNKKIIPFITEGKEYVAYVSKVSGFDITVRVVFEWDDVDIKSIIIPLPKKREQLNDERHERRAKRFEAIRRIAEEKRALVQSQYDKVLNTHQKKLNEFADEYKSIVECNDIKKLEKFLVSIEKEFDRIENKEDKRNDVFCDRSEKWQESEKGKLYDDITNELSDLSMEIEEIRDNVIKATKLIKADK